MTQKVVPYISLVLAACTVIILATTLLIITSGKVSPLPVKSFSVKTHPSPTPDIAQLYQTGSIVMGLNVVSVAPRDDSGTVLFKGHVTLKGIFKSPNCFVKFDPTLIPRITAVSDPSLCLTHPKPLSPSLTATKTGESVTLTIDDLSLNAVDGNYTATLISVLK